MMTDATHAPKQPLTKFVRDPEAFDFEYEVTRALTTAIDRVLEVDAVHALGLTPEPEPEPSDDEFVIEPESERFYTTGSPMTWSMPEPGPPEPEPGPAEHVKPSSPLCYCPAYPDPHEPGVGNCSATGNVYCPACAVILEDGDVAFDLVVPATYFDPPEYDIILLQPCGNCGLVGRI